VRLAVFVSPHGFGHAARSAAVLAALAEQEPALEVTLWTTLPRWFFAESLEFPFNYQDFACDVGLVQTSAVEEDLAATVERLERFWTGAKSSQLRDLVSELRAAHVEAVLCDISPLGLLAAREAGLPSILVESFTWDWIYEGYLQAEARFAPWVERMRRIFALADLRVQAEPVCAPLDEALEHDVGPAAAATVVAGTDPTVFPLTESLSVVRRGAVVRVPPIARRPRSTPAEVRSRLGIAPGCALALVSFGGVDSPLAALTACARAAGVDFVVPGGAASEERRGNVVLLPHHSPVHHPDLVAAADAVVGKLGYSTVAEAFAAGTRYAFVPRPRFRESALLARFVRRRLPCVELAAAELASGDWVERLPGLLAAPRPAPGAADGAEAAARAMRSFLAARAR